jgi:hypothetical protein
MEFLIIRVSISIERGEIEMFISNEASQFLRYLMEKRNKHGVRIGYNEKSK